MPRPLYMDANATTPVHPEVIAAMAPFWSEHFANPSSVHQPGQRARAALDRARDQVASLLGAQSSEIVFTSGGTESNNLALFGATASLLASSRTGRGTGGRPHLITSDMEHDAVLQAANALAERGEVELTLLTPSPSGVIEPATLAAALTPHTRLVSLMLANNETGAVQPIRELAALAHRAGALFHTDAVQAAGKLPVSVAELGCDLLTISGHKLYGPKGTGALFVRQKLELSAIHFGGPQERQRRAGTENVAGLVGLGHAASLARSWLHTSGPASLAVLRDRLEANLLAGIPGSRVQAAGVPRTPNTLNITLPGVLAEDLMIALDLQGMAVSAGSACQSGALEPSHVLRAIGLSEAEARATIRISLLRDVTPAEIEEASTLLQDTAVRLQRLGAASPQP